ncbi:type II toxin-antitoxin system VapC family toxin [Flavitalea sp. BT771]|uniref:type II toxin-antitoxin system VapC family toxin n=1 Tax=Flavitalea sp. BT771 TaxID=3063329 RepID=UPI0026E16102|nr:type II toxin-antitoxin system VapC family toxin [Flavitalea sp. BT771]MDO6433395.1 type II toxin-antitoxin system VapC family toxin [Flavitalea sp. BT771]MDV6222700.1 type II toxin-antitoxin system VapC family toxin [Flavitalea sp. BT771]
MTYLLDTHYVLWAVADSEKISRKMKYVLTNPDFRIIVSTISFWEVSLKSALGKLEISGFTPEELPGACAHIGFEIKHLSHQDSCTYHKLKAAYHKDPFDRMLIWQAIRNDYIFITADRQAKKYVSEGLKILAIA